MKRLLVTDTHLGLYSDADAWLDIVLDFYKHIVKYCYQNDIHQLIHLGDFFDNRKSLNTKTQHTAHRIAHILGKTDLYTYMILGNHDCYYKNQNHPNTLELFNKYDHIEVVDDITKVDDILLVPWGIIPVEKRDTKYCFGHFAINGFHMNDSYKCKTGTDKTSFRQWDKVLSGHFHTPSSNHNITYLGAPYAQTFHDAGGVRGYHTFEDGKLKFIEYKGAPKFIKINTGTYQTDEDSVMIKGNVIRIVFGRDYGITENQNFIDEILSHKPFLYSVDFANVVEEGEIATDVSIEMESKKQIVDQYIDGQPFPTNIQIGVLKSMFRKLMDEAGDTGIKSRSAMGTKIECDSIGFQNFLSFGSKWQDVSLYNGVNFVTGIDLDKGKSNGAGKSSFLETIPFALFGKTARDIKQDQIVNWKNKKNCQVVFRFKINEDMFEIKRSIKPNDLKIYRNGDPIDQDAHKSDYQSMFEEIFGMDAKMFMSLIHSNVNSSANILNMKKDEKRKFLERMFGLEIFSSMNKLCNEKLRNVENKYYKVETDWNACDDKIESTTRLKIKFLLEIKSKEATIESVDEIEEDLIVLLDDNPDIEDKIESMNKDITDKRDSFHKVTSEFDKWKSRMDTEVEHLQKEINQIEDQEEQREKNKETQARIDKIIQKAGKIEEITAKIDKHHKNEFNISEKVVKENDNISTVEKELVELKTDLKNIETNLELLAEGVCPVCGQDVKDPKTHYKKEQTSFKKKIANRETKLTKIKNEKSSLTAAWDDTRTIITTLGSTKERLYNLELKLKEVGSEEKKDELVKDKNDKIEKLKGAKSLYDKKETKHSNEIEAMKNKVDDLSVEMRKINAKQKEYDLAESEARVEKKHIKSLEAMIKEQDDETKKAKAKIEVLKTSKLKLNDIKDYLNVIKGILKDENIKQYCVKKIMPFMNKQVNYYLSEVNYGFYVKIDKWLDVEIKGPGIRNATYGSLSGGERRGIDIAIQLALIDVARTQAGVFPDLLVFDELLDSSIDGRGINELMKIVRTKQKEFGGKIFIISHRDEIDNEMMDYQYKVVKENGYSKVHI